jgi:hypothetical protein
LFIVFAFLVFLKRKSQKNRLGSDKQQIKGSLCIQASMFFNFFAQPKNALVTPPPNLETILSIARARFFRQFLLQL